ncbi:twin-arginine translocase TatA/TatE family subunit [Deinococcus psychrotolerans]|uniref:Sec-independent protein translocase protein TatA n=2 Tax=Deinococcus TaxID=1298 RepID=A0A553ULU6_9DEIO|nr:MULTISPECIES: twin-arginine translocase TatA/TatE family subunit [Deinococcus]AZI41979.1 twin-arginine translocase TatA/TatE family subunit [Deinococcus psychrotolerans]TSA81162.1 twin-arginine translocase TatA/TatE family subunit [Deinococcus detaillensis]
MPNLGMPEILLILVAALLVFGPKKLPDLGKSLGNGIREFRKGTQGLKDELEGSFKEESAPVVAAANAQTILAPSAPAAVVSAASAVTPAPVAAAPVSLSKETAEVHQA